MTEMMTQSAQDFICGRCGYSTDKYHNLLRHLQRKHICKPVLDDIDVDDLLSDAKQQYHKEPGDYICDKCDKMFASRQSRHRHMKVCTTSKVQKPSTEELIDKVHALEEALRKIQDEKCTSNVTNNTTNNTNNGTINNIHIHTFGKEDITHLLSHPNFDKYVLRCVKTKREGVMDLINRKHFDPLHPENHTVKKMNKKDPFIEVYKDGTWVLREKDDVLEDIFLGVQAVFGDFVQACADDIHKLKHVMDEFMRKVGEPLGWDLNCDVYTYMDSLSEKDKELYKKKIFQLACEYVYRRSQEIHK